MTREPCGLNHSWARLSLWSLFLVVSVSVPWQFFHVQMYEYCIRSGSHSSHVARACVIWLWALFLISSTPPFTSSPSSSLWSSCCSYCPTLLTSTMWWTNTLRTSAWGPWHPGRERSSHSLWDQRPLHPRDLWRIHPGVHRRAAVPWWLRLRHHRQDAAWRVPKTSRSLWTRRPVVLSVVVSQSWQNGETRCLLTCHERPRNSETQLWKWTVGTLLEWQREQILADRQAEIRKREFQADYDRKSILKFGEIVDSQREELHCARAEVVHRRDQQLLQGQVLQQKLKLREAHQRSLSEMEELKKFQSSTFDTFARRKLVEDQKTNYIGTFWLNTRIARWSTLYEHF